MLDLSQNVTIQSMKDAITAEIEKIHKSNIVIVIDSIAPLLFINNRESEESVICSNIARVLYQIVNCKHSGTYSNNK